ncbi:hypothetical protein [Methanoregula sp.]|uniref:hypothetical protein n=1 Tax=Methanoregula sp. TaxID=2052170 RepID=UPI003C1EDA88
MKLPNSSSDFSVYSTNGEQLTGDLAGYNELAHQLDKKRIVFYFEVSERIILLGTRLMVQIIGGREERAIFIKKYAASEFSMKGDFINRFYDDARTHVENLQEIKYRVLGLLNEGDLPVRERSSRISTLSAIIGKILIHVPVKIKIEDLSLSFGMLMKIVESCNQKNIPNYKITIAQYPYDEDVLISPNIMGMDLEILNNGEEKIQPVFEKDQTLFRAISEIFEEQRNRIKNTDFQDKNKFSRILKSYLIDSDILDEIIKQNPKETQDILDLYQDDSTLLYEIARKIFVYNKTLYGIDKKFIILIVDYIIKSVNPPDSDDIEILKTGYINGNKDLKNVIRKYLISHGVFEEYFLKDLLNTSIKTCDLQLLESVITNPSFNEQRLQILNNTIQLHNFEQTEVLDFIECMFESNFEQERKGHSIYQAVLQQYQKKQFNKKKLNQLQDQYKRALIPLPQATLIDTIFVDGINKKLLILLLVSLIAIIGIIVYIFFIGLPGLSGEKATNQIVNQTIPPPTNQMENQVLPHPLNQTVNQTTLPTDTQTIPQSINQTGITANPPPTIQNPHGIPI